MLPFGREDSLPCGQQPLQGEAPKQHRGDSPLGMESVTTPSITFKWTTLVVALLNSVTSEIHHPNPAEAVAAV